MTACTYTALADHCYSQFELLFTKHFLSFCHSLIFFFAVFTPLLYNQSLEDMYILTSIFSCTLLLPSVVFGLVARSTLPPQFIIDFLGNASDSSFPHVYRDGGCGGTVGGKHIIVYCDTSTTIGTNNDKLIGFTSNSIAIVSGPNALS